MKPKICALFWGLFLIPALFLSMAAFSQDTTSHPDAFTQTAAPREIQKSAAVERKWPGVSTVTPRDPLVIAITRDLQPFSFLDAEAQPAGMFVDMWKLWAEKTGHTIQFLPSSWQETLDNLKNGNADIHAGLFFSDSRAQWMDFCQPFYEVDIGVFFPVNQEKISSVDDLKGQKVGVTGGTHMGEYLRQHCPEIEVVTFPSDEDAVRAAQDGKIRAFVSGFPDIILLLEHLGWPGKFESLDDVLYTRTVHAGILKGRQTLVTLVDQGFDAISQEELAEIERRWLPKLEPRYYHARSQKLHLTAVEEAWLREHRTLRVGMYVAPPFATFDDDGAFHGIFGDYLDLISDRTGLRFDVIPATISDISVLAQARKIDLYPGSEILEHLAHMNFSDPFFLLHWGIVNRINAPSVRGMQDLEGKTVTLYKDSPIRQYIRDHYPSIRLSLAVDTEQALRAVSTNHADAFIGTLMPASYTIQRQQFTNLKIATSLEYPDLLMKYAVRNDWPELLTILNKAIASITPQEHDDIVRNRIPIQYEHTVNWTVVWQWIGLIVAVSGLLLSVTLLWNRRMAKEVAERKHAEAALAKARDELEIRVQERTAELVRANESLRESEERFRVMAECSHDLLTVADEQGKTLWANAAWQKTLGYTPETQGDPIENIYPDDRARVLEVFQALGDNESAFTNVEYRYRTASGGYVTLETTARRRIVAGKSLLYTLAHDITERKQAEEALRESEELHRIIMENILDPVFITDDDGHFTFICPNVPHILEYTLEELQAKGNIAALVGEELFARNALDARGEIRNIERVVVDKAGRARIYLITVKRVSIQGGTVLYACRDITERKQAEEERGNLAKFPSENPNPVLRIAKDGTLLYANEASLPLLNVWGVQEDRPLPEDRQTFVSDVFHSGSHHTTEVACEDRILSLTFAPVADADYVNVYGFDITERKQAEAALRESEEKYRTLFKHLPIPVFTKNCAGEYTSCNAENLKYWAVDPIGHTDAELFDPETAATLRKTDLRVIDSGETLTVEESLSNTPLGTRQVLSCKMPLRDSSGSIVGVLGASLDITERKRTEEALRESEERFRGVFEMSPTGIALVDTATQRFLEANKSFLQIMGYSLAELQHLTVMDVTHPDDWEKEAEIIRAYLSGALPSYVVKKRYIRKDGKIRWVRTTGDALYLDPGGPPLGIANVEDITERKQMEEELQQYREHLEELVRERTRELEAKTEELETFNQAMVDREIRIIEMKEEVNRFCEELGREPKYPPVWK